MWYLPQLHISHLTELHAEIAPVKNRDFFIKPIGGLWTSTYHEGSSAWVDWCRAEEFGDPDAAHWHVMRPDPATRVFVIDTLADLRGLLSRYPHPDREQRIYTRFMAYIDFERMSLEYDALHLTHAGQLATRYSEPSLNGWDVESTIWFRWRFLAAETHPRVSSN